MASPGIPDDLPRASSPALTDWTLLTDSEAGSERGFPSRPDTPALHFQAGEELLTHGSEGPATPESERLADTVLGLPFARHGSSNSVCRPTCNAVPPRAESPAVEVASNKECGHGCEEVAHVRTLQSLSQEGSLEGFHDKSFTATTTGSAQPFPTSMTTFASAAAVDEAQAHLQQQQQHRFSQGSKRTLFSAAADVWAWGAMMGSGAGMAPAAAAAAAVEEAPGAEYHADTSRAAAELAALLAGSGMPGGTSGAVGLSPSAVALSAADSAPEGQDRGSSLLSALGSGGTKGSAIEEADVELHLSLFEGLGAHLQGMMGDLASLPTWLASIWQGCLTQLTTHLATASSLVASAASAASAAVLAQATAAHEAACTLAAQTRKALAGIQRSVMGTAAAGFTLRMAPAAQEADAEGKPAAAAKAGSSGWALGLVAVLGVTSVAAVMTASYLFARCRQLNAMVMRRDRDLARLLVKILNLQQTLSQHPAAASSAPYLRHSVAVL